MSEQKAANQAETIERLAREAAVVTRIATPDGREFAVVPSTHTVKDVTPPGWLPPDKPKYIAQAVTVQTQDSLVEYVKKFKTADTALFADIANNRIVAQIDYHAAKQAERVVHCATMQLAFSEEWKTWTGIDDKLMKQLDFARFIEENSADIVAPTGGELLEVCRDLQAVRSANFKKAVRTNTDHENFEFTDNTDMRSKNGVEVPTKFELSLPVYFGERSVPLQAFLRWNLVGEQLALGVKLHRAEHVRQAIFREIVGDVSARTDCMAVFGRIGS
ncbi:MAG: DUF2303 family protein [Hyphomicrobium sp.]|uniref:DUF2303 family protein n=1 Tax=Hyphomicrobium sp. TaxID=82 RepID=UPI003561D814